MDVRAVQSEMYKTAKKQRPPLSTLATLHTRIIVLYSYAPHVALPYISIERVHRTAPVIPRKNGSSCPRDFLAIFYP